MQQGERAVSDVMTFELRGAVALLTLNRPEKLNALSNELLGSEGPTTRKRTVAACTQCYGSR